MEDHDLSDWSDEDWERLKTVISRLSLDRESTRTVFLMPIIGDKFNDRPWSEFIRNPSVSEFGELFVHQIKHQESRVLLKKLLEATLRRGPNSTDTRWLNDKIDALGNTGFGSDSGGNPENKLRLNPKVIIELKWKELQDEDDDEMTEIRKGPEKFSEQMNKEAAILISASLLTTDVWSAEEVFELQPIVTDGFFREVEAEERLKSYYEKVVSLIQNRFVTGENKEDAQSLFNFLFKDFDTSFSPDKLRLGLSQAIEGIAFDKSVRNLTNYEVEIVFHLPLRILRHVFDRDYWSFNHPVSWIIPNIRLWHGIFPDDCKHFLPNRQGYLHEARSVLCFDQHSHSQSESNLWLMIIGTSDSKMTDVLNHSDVFCIVIDNIENTERSSFCDLFYESILRGVPYIVWNAHRTEEKSQSSESFVSKFRTCLTGSSIAPRNIMTALNQADLNAVILDVGRSFDYTSGRWGADVPNPKS